MKKYLLILISLVMASALSLAAQSLVDNPSYQKSLELKAQATQAFDAGEYDKAAELANEAKDYAALSDQYVEMMVARTKANRAIGQARDRLAGVVRLHWDTMYPAPYGLAAVTLKDAQDAFDSENYSTASIRAKEAIDATDAIAKVDSEAAIAEARTGLATADSLDGATNYPREYADGTSALKEATGSYDGGDYPSAATRARDASKAFAMIMKVEKPVAAAIEWPAVYIVRLIPARRDCLWRIAEYPFIYNNPLKWPVIYEANKKTFRDPGNPNLIFPGQKLQIPAIRGETRSGTYDPKTVYKVFPRK